MVLLAHHAKSWLGIEFEVNGEPFPDGMFDHALVLAGAVEGSARTMQPAYSDLQVTIDDLIAVGDNVVACATFSGTHSGPLLGYPATGKQAVLTALYLFKFADGRIRTMMFEANFYRLLVNLGLIAIPGVQET